MEISKFEMDKIESIVRKKLKERFFSFESISLTVNADGTDLKLNFKGATHTVFKRVRIMNQNSFIKDTSLARTMTLELRFLHGNHTSPSIGFGIAKLKERIS